MRPLTASGRILLRRGLSASAVALPLLVLLTSGPGRAQQRCEPPDARVVSIQGTVELKRAGTDVWAPVALEEALCIGDAVRVGAASRAALVLANDATLRLDQRTMLQLRGIAEEERSLLDLVIGAVYFFSHRPRALEVDTPFVNAAAEGTEFLVRVGDDRAEVVMLDGQVLLRNPHGELRVASGDAALVREGEAPAPMIVARPRDAVAWVLYYPPVLADLAGRGASPRPLPPGLQAAVERVADNDYAGALQALETVPEAARDARYHTYLAGVLLNVGRVEEAEDAIERALALDPEAGEALAQRAIIHVVQNRKEDALADARRAAELSPESSAARIALSYALQAAFQLEEARAVLREAVERNPDDALAWARLAELELMFGNLSASRDAAERAVALAPGLSRTHMVLGFAALTHIAIDEARAAFERAIALDSANPLPRLGLGLAKIRQSDLEDGRQEIEIAAALDPNDALIRSYLGKVYFEEKRDDLANDQFAIARELDPLDPTAYLYEAIKQQTENRPGEALQNLHKSIELNENRAVYRSRLLLDADRAARGTSLARIYEDLGFFQLGQNEASHSLKLDPANASAHRFLSDIYRGVRRREIARVSELLQAQMLQDININPVQPSLSETNLNIVTQGGPADPGFNEFTPLFERQQAQLNVSGLSGNNDTYGGEGVVSMFYDRYSLSAGAFGYRTDGWRDNNDIKQNIEDVYFQAAITPELNAQVEFRRRDSDNGDLAFNFDPDFFLPNLRRDLDQDTYRAGLRYSPTPHSDVLLSYIHSDRDERATLSFPQPTSLGIFDANQVSGVDDNGDQSEVQYLARWNRFNATLGFAYSETDRSFDRQFTIPDLDFEVDSSFGSQITHPRGYLYGNINFPDPVVWTAAVSVEDYDESALEVEKINPKFGLQFEVTDDLLLRGAVFRTIKPALVANQTLEPTHVAGFNQFFDDFNATESWRYGGGLDWRPMESLFAGAEVSWRDLKVPVFQNGDSDVVFEDQEEQLHRAYLHWLPTPELVLSTEFVYDRFRSEQGNLTDGFQFPKGVETISVPVGVRYFHPLGFFAGVGVTYVHQNVDRTEAFGDADGDDSFTVVDVSVGYRLPNRFGIVSLSVSNLFDTGFKYQDDSFREFQDAPSIGPYFPERLVFGRLTLNF